MDDSNHRIAECAKATAIATIKAMTIDGKVNLPTMVTAAARMSGSYRLRSLGLDISHVPPGEPVLHAGAEQATASLLTYCATILTSLGTKVPADPPASMDEHRKKIAMNYLGTQAQVSGPVEPLQGQFQLSDEQMARAVAGATAILIHQFSKYMEVGAAFGYAAYGFTEGVRTAPQPLGNSAA